MSINHSQDIPTSVGQSPGYDPKTSKRSSGLFSFFKWFKSSPSRESSVPDLLSSSSSSCDSINSRISTGTAASFSFVPPKSYNPGIPEKKCIAPEPETDTYKARIKERDRRREKDKNVTLRKKYNLFFNRETLLKPKAQEDDDSSRSLPLMTRKTMENTDEESRLHRRTNSESSKLKKAGAYCHVKGKRRAPQPPLTKSQDSTLSLRRRKRLAPQPPTISPDQIRNSLKNTDKFETIEYADADVICNDSLKLDHGVLKPVKEQTSSLSLQSVDTSSSAKSDKPMELTAVSPRPWYKRNVNRDSAFVPKKEPFKVENRYEPIQRLPEVKVSKEAELEEHKPLKLFNGSNKDDAKRKSGMSFLTNISELDREATEIIKREHSRSDLNELDPPPFMRPKQEEKNTDTWVSPKRKSAKDLIAKFNAITNVTKVTVNSAFFGSKDPGSPQKDNFKRDYFGRQISVREGPPHQNKIKKLDDKYFGKIDPSEKKLIENNDRRGVPLMKSESAVTVNSSGSKPAKKETPKIERKNWNCPKCSIENDYWRIICHVCSTIKPYFDDLTASTPKNNSLEKNKTQNSEIKHFPVGGNNVTDNSKYTPFKSVSDTGSPFERHFERSKTQIGFSALSKINQNKAKDKFVKSVSVDETVSEDSKREEREKLKKMLIEMKNSLPKKKNSGKHYFRSSIIQENPENIYEESKRVQLSKDHRLKLPDEKNVGVTKPENNKTNTKINENASDNLTKNEVKSKIEIDIQVKPADNKENKVVTIFKENKVSVTPTENKVKVASAENHQISAKPLENKIPKLLNEKKVSSQSVDIKLPSSSTTDDRTSAAAVEIKIPTTVNENRNPVVPTDNKISEKSKDISFPTKEEKIIEAIIKTEETIYENIKVRKPDGPKPAKVSSSAQTNGVVFRKFAAENSEPAASQEEKTKNHKYEPMRPRDFANIYTEKMDIEDENHIYANLIENGNLFLNMPVNFNDIRNKTANNTDTLEIGRLLKRLETAIAKGELGEAANYAKELAQLKVNCSVIRQKSEEEKVNPRKDNTYFTVDVYVEDKVSHRGPFPIRVKGDMTVGELKSRVERDFEIPVNVQKWIIGKQLASNDNAKLNDLHIHDEGTPLFLYLVAPQKTNDTKTENLQVPLATGIKDPGNSKHNIDKNKDIIPSAPRIDDAEFPDNCIYEDTIPEIKLKENHGAKPKEIKEISTKPNVILPAPLENFEGGTNKEIVQPLSLGNSKEVKLKDNNSQPISSQIFQETVPKVIIQPTQLQNTPKEVAVQSVSSKIPSKEIIAQPSTVQNLKENSSQQTPLKLSKESTTKEVTLPQTSSKIPTSTSSKEAPVQPTSPKKSIEVVPKIVNVKPKTSAEDNKEENARAIIREDFEDYDTKTLKATNEDWECIMCTLLNPKNSNICAVCATVRKITPSPSPTPDQAQKVTRHRKYKAPQPQASKKKEHYLQLVNLDNADLVENTEPFECLICFMEIEPGEGVTLRECLHQFCKPCLAHTIEFSEDAEVKCPYRDEQYSCEIPLQDREIKALVSKEVYDQYLGKSMAQAENKMDNSFHCKTPDCKGWCIYEDNVNEFKCPVCRQVNCLTCQAIHAGLNCKQYQERVQEESSTDENAKRTREMLQEMVNRGEALNCPTCQVILMKKWGCDWLRCSMCKTEICWVTRGPRWGPAGKGDTSGGCQCGVNGVKCHPQCNYCH